MRKLKKILLFIWPALVSGTIAFWFLCLSHVNYSTSLTHWSAYATIAGFTLAGLLGSLLYRLTPRDNQDRN